MKNPVKTLLAAIVLVLLVGCDGPVWQFPGGAFSGAEQSLAMASIPAEGGVLQLETDPTDPYSVNVGFRTIDGSMYIDPAAERGWYQRIQKDPAVRIRLEGAASVYLATAVVVTDADLLAQYDDDRIVLRLAPR